jgi:hypothetical protein
VTLYDKLTFPKACCFDIVMENSFVFRHSRISKDNQTLIKSHVKQFTIKYNLKPENTGKSAYSDDNVSFPEIQIMEAELNSRSIGPYKFDFFTLARVILDAVPYPMLLIFRHETYYRMIMAVFHTGKVDESKNVIEDIISSDWISTENPSCKDLRMLNAFNQCYRKNDCLYSLFQSWIEQIKLYTEWFRKKHKALLLLDYEDDERYFSEIGYVGNQPYVYYEIMADELSNLERYKQYMHLNKEDEGN